MRASIGQYKVVRQYAWLHLIYNGDGRYSVVNYNEDKNQVVSVMPGDVRHGGMRYVGSPKGMRYVTRWYPRQHALKVFRELRNIRRVIDLRCGGHTASVSYGRGCYDKKTRKKIERILAEHGEL